MNKLVLLVAFCVFLFVECKPSKEKPSVRIPRQVSESIGYGQITSQVASTVAEAARRALEMGKSAVRNITQSQFGSSQIPEIG